MLKAPKHFSKKGKKQMLAYDLDVALPMRHEYHRRDTRTVVGGSLHVSQGFNLKLCRAIYGLTPETMKQRKKEFCFANLLPYYDSCPLQKQKIGQKMSEKIIIPGI